MPPDPSFSWTNNLPAKVDEEADPCMCMIDETAIKIIFQICPKDNRLSAMPWFVQIRNIPSDFSVKAFFGDLKIQSDTKSNEKICGVVQVNAS